MALKLDDLDDEDRWWLRWATAPIDSNALIDGRLSLEDWRRQRIDVRPRWRRRLEALRGRYVMRVIYKW